VLKISLKKALRKLLKITLAFFGLMLVLILAGTYILERNVKSVILSEINKQLTVDVSVKKISLSLIRHFPQVTLRFEDVQIPSLPGDTAPLLAAERLSLRFNLLQVVRGNYMLRNLDVNDGRLNLFIPRHGKPNYLIFKEGSGESTPFNIDLRKVKISNVDIRYHSESDSMRLHFLCKNNSLRGRFSTDQYDLKAAGDLCFYQSHIAGNHYFSGQQAEIDLEMVIDNNRNLYTISKGDVEIEGIPLGITGEVSDQKGNGQLHLSIEGREINLRHLASILPEKLKSLAAEYDPDGEVQFKGAIKGGYSGGKTPDISFHFGIKNAKIKHQESGTTLQDIACTGEFLTSQDESYFRVSRLTASLPNGKVGGELVILDFENPQVIAEIHADMPVSELSGFLSIKDAEVTDGNLKANLKLESSIALDSEWTIGQLLHCKTSGDIQFTNLTVKAKNYPEFSGVEGNFRVDNNEIQVKTLKGKLQQEPFTFSGSISNLIPYLISGINNLTFRGNLHLAELDISDLAGTGKQEKRASLPPIRIPGNISGMLNLQVDRIKYDLFTAERLRTTLKLASGTVTAESLRMEAFSGVLDGALVLTQENDSKLRLEADIRTNHTDINLLFKQCRNFGQDDLTDQHLRGFMSGLIRFSTSLKSDGTLLWPTLEAIGDIMVEDGALLDYKPVMELARYTRIDDLSNIHFKTLQNQIKITNRRVIIPQMEISSDAADLTVSGIHDFDGNIEYHLSILLSDILSKKAKIKNTGNVDMESETDARGRLTLYLLVDGTDSKPNVHYDKRSYRRSVQQELKTEKETVKELLKKEFGTFSHQNPDQDPRARKSRQEGEILIEWEDE
jgi:hypothetical protein